MSELLRCPKDDKICQFASFCASKKESLEEGGTLAEELIETLPDPISETLSQAGYCSDDRIGALQTLASDTYAQTATVALILASQIKSARENFPTADCDPTAPIS